MSTFDDAYYTASLINFLGRRNRNRRKAIVGHLGINGIDYLLKMACVNHCLCLEQVPEALIENMAFVQIKK